MKFNAELTDTMKGEANYCWVHRVTFDAPANASTRLLIRRAKRAAGLSHLRHRVTWDCGDLIRLDFASSVLFISPEA